MVYQHLPQGGQELILNQEYVSLKALDGFFLHRSLISKSFAHLYLSSAISDLNRWILFLGSSTLLLLSAQDSDVHQHLGLFCA